MTATERDTTQSERTGQGGEGGGFRDERCVDDLHGVEEAAELAAAAAGNCGIERFSCREGHAEDDIVFPVFPSGIQAEVEPWFDALPPA